MRPSLFYVIALFIAIADQLSKWAVLRSLPYGASRSILGRYLYLNHTHNTGGAFSLLQAGNTIFIVVAGIAVVALIYAYHRLKRTDLLVSGALSLALGGAIGNVIDRVRFGYVVDFFDIRNGANHTLWPIFNVADSAISVGIVLLAWHFLFVRPPAATAPERSETPEAAEHATGGKVAG